MKIKEKSAEKLNSMKNLLSIRDYSIPDMCKALHMKRQDFEMLLVVATYAIPNLYEYEGKKQKYGSKIYLGLRQDM